MLESPAGLPPPPTPASPVDIAPVTDISPSGTLSLAADGAVVPEAWRSRLLRFWRTMLVGFWANVLDFALLVACLRWLEIAALPSRIIALVLSGALTFVGIRSFAFRVQGGNVPRQVGRFMLAEVVALPLNLLSFQLCTLCAPLAAPELVSFVANALVFVIFSYPVRRLVVFGAARGRAC